MSDQRINTCRFCGKSAHADWLIKYGTRAYAHPECYGAKKTMREAASLPLSEKRKLEEWIWDRGIAQKKSNTK